jgi:hypothetical protein
VLHALIAGQSPLAGENAMADLISGKPLRVSRDLPDDVYDVVVRATRLAKEDRFATAGEMAAALGKALARRIDRDARTMMREWMARLRPTVAAAPPPPAAGKLDGLLGGNLVFDGLRKSVPPGEVVAGPPPSETLERPPRKRGMLVVAGVVPVLGAAVAIGVWTMRGPAEAKVDAAPIAVANRSPPPVVTPLAPPPVAIASLPAVDAGTADAAAVVIERPRPRPRPVPQVTEPAPPPRPTGNGVLAIGGGGALRSEILVDGQSRGFAPRVLTLPVGSHDVVLVRPDGARVERTVTVHASHTPSAPLRWEVP